jgi:hypothetical protein
LINLFKFAFAFRIYGLLLTKTCKNSASSPNFRRLASLDSTGLIPATTATANYFDSAELNVHTVTQTVIAIQ